MLTVGNGTRGGKEQGARTERGKNVTAAVDGENRLNGIIFAGWRSVVFFEHAGEDYYNPTNHPVSQPACLPAHPP